MKCKHRIQIEDLDYLSAINLYSIGPANNKIIWTWMPTHVRLYIIKFYGDGGETAMADTL